MATKTLRTQIQLRVDTLDAWTTANPTLLAGEVAIVRIPEGATGVVVKPGIAFKVGDGTTAFNDLGYTESIAMDVYDWAKAETKPEYAASEITGLDEYIAGEIQDTNTKYQIVQNETDGRIFTLQSQELGESTWTDVSTITIPEKTYTLATGTANGTVSFNGTDVAVAGLKSAAYEEASAFDAAGSAEAAKEAVIGQAGDGADADTIYGAKAYADAAVAAKAIPEYTVAKMETAEEGYIASYQLMKDGVQAGATINIPKDYLVKSASIKEATADDPSGFPEGTKYIDFVINTYDTEAGTGVESHIYLNVAELVDAYTAGNGIEISGTNEVSAKVVAGNGLSVDADGIKMAAVSETGAGAMTPELLAELKAATNEIDALEPRVDSLETDMEGLATIARTGNVNDLVQTEGDVLILNCGGAAQ